MTLQEWLNYTPPWYKRAWYATYRAPSNAYYAVKNGVRGLWYWAPFAWRWRSWDFQYGLDALEHHLKALEPVCRKGISMSGEHDAKQIRVALFLLKRLRDDEYLYTPEPECRTFKTAHWCDRQSQDWSYLFDYMKKHMRRWWN